MSLAQHFASAGEDQHEHLCEDCQDYWLCGGACDGSLVATCPEHFGAPESRGAADEGDLVGRQSWIAIDIETPRAEEVWGLSLMDLSLKRKV